MKKLVSILLIFSLLMFAGCTSTEQAEEEEEGLSGTLKLDGSTTVYPVADAAAKIFMERNPGVTIDVQQSSSGEGYAKFLAGEIDISDGTRAPKDAEYEEGEALGMDLQMTIISNDAVAVHVNANNPISDMDIETIKAIFFDGTITDWSQISDEISGPINIYTTNPANSGTAELFNKKISGSSGTPYVENANANLQEQWGQVGDDGKLWVHPTPRMIDLMAADSNGIAYTPLKWINEDAKGGSPTVKALKVNGVYPTSETVLDTSYPLARKMTMVTDGKPQGIAREFINFILSDEGQQIVEEQGFIPIN
ncbi:hypothetical protein C0585_02210 [Candidatus Woesearchaeota archaeon]|nr:MAG: hypothetical protein C0585_02210 [Candidatus Woesearchaeota archaeon]